jgi:hypothetical protein
MKNHPSRGSGKKQQKGVGLPEAPDHSGDRQTTGRFK